MCGEDIATFETWQVGAGEDLRRFRDGDSVRLQLLALAVNPLGDARGSRSALVFAGSLGRTPTGDKARASRIEIRL